MKSDQPKPSPRSRIVERIVSRPGISNRWRARRYGLDYLLRQPPVLELYYEPGDPHSHLAAQLLPRLAQRLRIPLRVRVVGEPDPVVYPEGDKQRAFALQDAARIAPAYGLSFPSNAVRAEPEIRDYASRVLLPITDVLAFCAAEKALVPALFTGAALASDQTAPANPDHAANLAAHHQRRAALGNYLPGVWQLNGNWYWGIDRLDHLEADLRAAGWLDGAEPLAVFDPQQADLPTLDKDATELEFFFSFRSPYSYLAVEEIERLADRLPVALRIRPVLPMAMRGMKIPTYKGLYLARDVYREAAKRKLAFGRIADPLGVATERCLTLFNLLADSRSQRAFLLSHCRAVWSEGIDVATDEGLRFVWQRAGQSWPEAAEKLAQGMDLALAETHRQALFESGLWGVPSFRLGRFATWGNDRIWMLEELFRRDAER